MPNTATAITAAVSTSQTAGTILIDAAAAVVVFVALVRIVATPAALWAHGRLSKTAWIIAAIWFSPHTKSFLWPLGAIAAIWHTHTLARRAEQTAKVPDLRYAEGNAEPAPPEKES